jgi:hypothetical protein
MSFKTVEVACSEEDRRLHWPDVRRLAGEVGSACEPQLHFRSSKIIKLQPHIVSFEDS